MLNQTFVESENNHNSTLGQIYIYPQDLFSTSGEPKQSGFDIIVKARHTRWYYYVFNRSGLILHEPKVTDGKGLDFEPSVTVTTDNGEQALLFTCGAKSFVMRESVQSPLDLVNHITMPPWVEHMALANKPMSKALIRGLPIPNTDQIKVITQDGEQCACSEMYVYL